MAATTGPNNPGAGAQGTGADGGSGVPIGEKEVTAAQNLAKGEVTAEDVRTGEHLAIKAHTGGQDVPDVDRMAKEKTDQLKGEDKAEPEPDTEGESGSDGDSDGNGGGESGSEGSDGTALDQVNEHVAKHINTSVKAAKAASTAEVAGKGLVLAKALEFTQMAILAILQSIASGINAVGGILAKITGFFANVGATIGGFFSATGAAIGSTVGAVAVWALVPTVAAVVAVSSAGVNAGIKDASVVESCAKDANATVAKLTDDVDVDAAMLDNARKIWSFLKSNGLSDKAIAGILGNMQNESSLDPTILEAYTTPAYKWDDKKNYYLFDGGNEEWFALIQRQYAGTSVSFNPSAYMTEGGHYGGFGLIQWTAGRVHKIVKAAKAGGYKPWDLDFQIAYMLTEKGYEQWYEGMKASSVSHFAGSGSTPSDYSLYFSEHVEGNTVNAIEERKTYAENWYKKMSAWSMDSQFAAAATNIAKKLGTLSDTKAANEVVRKCNKVGFYDNSSISNAAVSLAWPPKNGKPDKESAYRDVTDTYRKFLSNTPVYGCHEKVYGMDCGVGVAAAIHWSGADDDYPSADTGAQRRYMFSSDRWKHVGRTDQLKYDDLLPGDVLVNPEGTSGHTMLFIGNKAVRDKYPDADANIDTYESSCDDYAPYLHADYVMAGGGRDHEKPYEVFRLVKPQTEPSKYADYVSKGKTPVKPIMD